MEEKDVQSKLNLQEARDLARESSLQVLRPHGKMWGMDVFSWYKAQVFELENTLLAFPFPIIWLGEKQEVIQLMTECPHLAGQLHACLIYDSGKIPFMDQQLADLKQVIAASSLQDALELLKGIKQRRYVLLFTASSENWKQHQEKFEFFVSLHQG